MLVVNLFKLQQQQQLLTLSFIVMFSFLHAVPKTHVTFCLCSNETVAQIDATVIALR